MKETLDFSTNPERIDPTFVSDELSQTYWGENRTPGKLKRIIRNCFVIGMYRGSEQIGFGRVVTDYETHAYIMDVIVKESERGKGYGKRIMEKILGHPAFREIEAFSLKTKDAGSFYESLGFKLKNTEQYVLLKKDWDNRPRQAAGTRAPL